LEPLLPPVLPDDPVPEEPELEEPELDVPELDVPELDDDALELSDELELVDEPLSDLVSEDFDSGLVDE
jgi:hypothetical protein